MDALKSKKRFIQENAFKQKREEPRLKFNPGLSLVSLRTTGPWAQLFERRLALTRG